MSILLKKSKHVGFNCLIFKLRSLSLLKAIIFGKMLIFLVHPRTIRQSGIFFLTWNQCEKVHFFILGKSGIFRIGLTRYRYFQVFFLIFFFWGGGYNCPPSLWWLIMKKMIYLLTFSVRNGWVRILAGHRFSNTVHRLNLKKVIYHCFHYSWDGKTMFKRLIKSLLWYSNIL